MLDTMDCGDGATYCLQCSTVCYAVLSRAALGCAVLRTLLSVCLLSTLTPFGSIGVQEKLSSMLMRLDQLAPTAFMPIRCPPSAPDGPTWGGIKPTMICKDNRSRTVAEGIYRGFFGPFVDVGEGEDEVR